MSHLINTIFPFQIKHRNAIPINPCVDLPSRQEHLKLGTTSKDADGLNENNEKKKQKIVEDAENLVSKHDYGHQFQPLSQPTSRSLLVKYIEKMFEVIEPDRGETKLSWYKGKVVLLIRNKLNLVTIDWEEEGVLHTNEILLQTKWKKTDLQGAWRLFYELK